MIHLITILGPYPVNRISVEGGPWLSLVDDGKACLDQLDVHPPLWGCAVDWWGSTMLTPKEAGIAG